MTDLLSSVRQTSTRVRNRLTGLLLRAIGYGTGDPSLSVVAPTTLVECQMWAEMAGERRVHSIVREA